MFTRNDRLIAYVFFTLTLLFIVSAFMSEPFFTWLFDRHHNQLSWYIRPIFILPFCFFAFKQSLSGIAVTLFLLFTSMAWFPKPDIVSPDVQEFLKMEMDYLTGRWSVIKVLITLLVPVSMTLLALAFWKKSIKMGFAIMTFIAFGKITWSVFEGGESGKSIIIPAMLGLLFCACVLFFIIKFKKNDSTKEN